MLGMAKEEPAHLSVPGVNYHKVLLYPYFFNVISTGDFLNLDRCLNEYVLQNSYEYSNHLKAEGLTL